MYQCIPEEVKYDLGSRDMFILLFFVSVSCHKVYYVLSVLLQRKLAHTFCRVLTNLVFCLLKGEQGL